MSENVTKWLQGLGLGQYAKAFEEGAIDWEVLPSLDHEILKELGVKLPGHRLRILNAIQDLGPRHAPADAPAPSETVSNKGILSELTDGDLSFAATFSAWERHAGERKPVTMLFADITGSTALTEKLDAEEAHDLLYGATQRMCEAVENNRGTVCRFMGDGVMAMFGAPMATEHHAVDACEAALGMQQAIRDYATNTDAGGLQIRVGLHSGEIVVLTVGEGDKVEYDASGPTVPIAARMEQAAEPGEVYISAATRSLAAKRIDTEALAPVSVKGISEPVSIFTLRRVRSAEEITSDATRSPFVGRRAELNQFRGILDTCIEEGHGQTIYVRGEPGIGKTRLVEEFTSIAAEKGVTCHRVLVLPFGVGRGQDAIRSLARSLLGITPGAGPAVRQQAADRALNDGRLVPDQAVFLNDLLDFPQPSELHALYDAMDNTTRHEGKQSVACNLLSAAGNNQPTLAVIEDVHWADTITLAHLAALTKTAADCPALVVLTSRIEGDQLDRQWLSNTEGSPFSMIELGPLRKQDSIALIGEFIDTRDSFAASCLERAAGNPLFLEQLLSNAKESTSESLPDSIQSLVLSRIDRLDVEDKRALQAASVMGQRFEADALNYLLGTTDYDVGQLADHNLVREEGAGFLFAHALIQEGVYASLIMRQRRELHAKAAAWFAGRDLVVHAEHLGAANDTGAASAFAAAAREQAGQHRIEKALELVRRGLGVVTESESFELKFLQGELLGRLGSTTESMDAYRQAEEAATSDAERCRAILGVSEGLRITARYDELLPLLERAESIAESKQLFRELARICCLRGNANFIRGKVDACLRAFTSSLEYARTAESAEDEAQALGGLGDAEYSRGRYLSAYRYFDECTEMSRDRGFGRIVAANLPMRAATLQFKTELDQAWLDCREALELAAKVRQPRAEMMSRSVAIYLLVEMGDFVELEKWARAGWEIAHRIGARVFEGSMLMTLARATFSKGERAEAQEHMANALPIVREVGMNFVGPCALGILALVTDDPAERCAALKEGEELLRGDCQGFNHFYFYRDAMTLCLELENWDEVDRYAQALEDYTSAEPTPWSDFFIGYGRALTAFGRGNRDDATMRKLKHLLDEAERVGLKIAVPRLKEALSLN